MNRTIPVIAVVTILLLAGCLSASNSSTMPTPDQVTTPTPSPVVLGAENVSAEPADVELRVAYHSRSKTSLPTTPRTLAEEGQKWLAVNMAVTNRGNESRELTSHQYIIQTDSDRYEFVYTDSEWALEETRVAPGETVTGWVIFHVPENVTEGTITIRNNTRRSFTINFTRNQSLNEPIQ